MIWEESYHTMPTCGDSGTDGPLPERRSGSVRIRRSVDPGALSAGAVPDVEPAEVQAFAREFRDESGLE
jgi:hypothetical protein